MAIDHTLSRGIVAKWVGQSVVLAPRLRWTPGVEVERGQRHAPRRHGRQLIGELAHRVLEDSRTRPCPRRSQKSWAPARMGMVESCRLQPSWMPSWMSCSVSSRRPEIIARRARCNGMSARARGSRESEAMRASSSIAMSAPAMSSSSRAAGRSATTAPGPRGRGRRPCRPARRLLRPDQAAFGGGRGAPAPDERVGADGKRDGQ